MTSSICQTLSKKFWPQLRKTWLVGPNSGTGASLSLRHFAQLELLNFSRARFRNFREHDVTRYLVTREMFSAPRNDVVGARTLAGFQFDEGAGCLAPFFV